MRKKLLQRGTVLAVATAAVAVLMLACSNDTGASTPVVKEVIKEVPVEKEVIKTVEVIKEVPVEKLVEVERLVPFEVEKIVEVEKLVEVEKIVQVIVEPTPAPAVPAAPAVYKLGIFEEPLTNNYWSYMGGPGGSVWTGYVLDGVAPTLYTYSDQRFDWIPSLADGFPTALTKENVDGNEFWTTEVNLKKGLTWSDGVEITASDIEFVVDSVLGMELGANWAALVDPAFVDHVEAVDAHKLKAYFKATDADGNPQTAGLSVWQFGLAFVPILAKHYWAPIVEEAMQEVDVEDRQAALYAVAPEGEPTAGGYKFGRWEPGSFFEMEADPHYFLKDSEIKQYTNGAYREVNERLDYDVTYYGEAEGPTSLEFVMGPHAQSEIFSMYGDQDAAILALAKGDVDFVFNPSGLGKGFQDRVKETGDLRLLTNPSNSVRHLGFNVRKAPMDSKEFRQAVATLIDKEFVAQTILQGTAHPLYAMVPAANGFWHNPDVPQIGKDLSRGERLQQATALLKSAGFTFETEPEISEDGTYVTTQGKGLKTPDGVEVPELTIVAPSPGYDPLRSTFAVWVERWLNDAGIPVRVDLGGFNAIVGELFSPTVAQDLDMWIFGWSLQLFPVYLEQFFSNRHAPESDGGYNFGGYDNAEFDRLALELLSEADLPEARDKVNQLQAFLADDLPYVMLYSNTIVDAYRPSKVQFPYTSTLGGIQSANGLQQEALFE